VLYVGDEPGGERCAVRTAGSETGVQRCVPSVDGDKIGAVDFVLSETGTELGSSGPAVKCEKLDRGALIKFTNLGATSQFRNKNRRAGKKSSSQLLGTEVQVNGIRQEPFWILGAKRCWFCRPVPPPVAGSIPLWMTTF
jgi:hypothetical protein